VRVGTFYFGKLGMDKIAAKIVALGVPGLVLLVAIHLSGLFGGAAIVAALATLGGPLGMIGGTALLGLMVLIMNALAEYGFEAIFKSVVRGLMEQGKTMEEIKKSIASCPNTKTLKLRLYDYLDGLDAMTDTPEAPTPTATLDAPVPPPG